MKKFTKRLTMIVAVLLSLVLLTSSVVSTTLAKYVVTKSGEVHVGLQEFGLTVTLKSNVDSSSKNILVEKTADTVKKGHTVTMKFMEVTLKPGNETYKNAIQASISGKSTVSADVSIKVEIKNSDDTKFKITSEDFSSGYDATGKIYNPIEFYVAGTGCGTANKTHNVGTNVFKTESEKGILTKMQTKAGANNTGITMNAYTSGSEATGTISEGATVNVPNLGLGFVWANASGDDADHISTFIGSKKPSFDITYTITVVQK